MSTNNSTDQTENARRALIDTGMPLLDLAANAGQTWDVDSFRAEFEPIGFLAPFVVVRRRSDGVKGSVEFTNTPRVYFNFVEDK